MEGYALLIKLPKTSDNPAIKKYCTPITNEQFMDYCDRMFSVNDKDNAKRQFEIRNAFISKKTVYLLPDDAIYGVVRFGIEGEWVYIDFSPTGNWGTFYISKSKKDIVEEANILEREIDIIEE